MPIVLTTPASPSGFPTISPDISESKTGDASAVSTLTVGICIGGAICCLMAVWLICCTRTVMSITPANAEHDEVAMMEQQSTTNIDMSTLHAHDRRTQTDSEQLYLQRVTTPTPQSEGGEGVVNNDVFKVITDILQQCDENEWETYLQNFVREKLNDDTLQYVDLEEAEIWKQLLPHIGVRYKFMVLWKDRKDRKAKQSQAQDIDVAGGGLFAADVAMTQ